MTKWFKRPAIRSTGKARTQLTRNGCVQKGTHDEKTVDETTLWGTWVHHSMLGIKLKEAMDELEMECYLEYADGHRFQNLNLNMILSLAH